MAQFNAILEAVPSLAHIFFIFLCWGALVNDGPRHAGRVLWPQGAPAQKDQDKYEQVRAQLLVKKENLRKPHNLLLFIR